MKSPGELLTHSVELPSFVAASVSFSLRSGLDCIAVLSQRFGALVNLRTHTIGGFPGE